MNAVILSGGVGTRVQPITYILPKPMVPILEEPLIGHLFKHLKNNGFANVLVTLSYKADIIENHYQTGEDLGLNLCYSLEGTVVDGQIVPKGLGSAGGLKKVKNFSHFLDKPFLVICGDALIDLDLSKIMEFHQNHKGIATVVCKEVAHDDVSKYGVVVTDTEGKITSFQEKPKKEEAKSNIVNTGIYIFDPAVLDYIPDDRPFDIGGELLPLLVAQNIPCCATSPEFQWVDVGSTADLYQANILALNQKIHNLNPRGNQIRENVWVGYNCNIDFDTIEIEGAVYIGNSVKIEKGVKIIGPCVIGSNSIIKQNVTLEGVVIFPHTIIHSDNKFKERLICNKYLVNPYGHYLDIEEHNLHSLIDDARKNDSELVNQNRAILETI